MEIIPIQTGTATIKPAQVRAKGHGAERIQNLFADPGWTAVPILAWAIVHPEGVIVVDTGETPRAMEPGYYPAEHPYYQYALRVAVKPEEGIGVQLRARGIKESDVKTVLLTHLHTDHAGGLHDFPKSTIWVHGAEHANAQGEAGIAAGYLPHRMPAWFAPRVYEFSDGPFGPFTTSQKVTKAGDVRVVPTPGHTPGHASVVVVDGGTSYFIAGDATYLEATLLDEAVDGVSPDEDVALATIKSIRSYLRSTPTVYLPSHDERSAERLRARTVTR
jgi:N-acyl homoserine lactone hydrolase